MQLAEMGIMLNISQQRYYPDEKPARKKKRAPAAPAAEPRPELKNA
jgi:cell division protein FtsW